MSARVQFELDMARGVPRAGRSTIVADAMRAAEEFLTQFTLTEDLQHDRLYGSVRIVNPFIEGSPTVLFSYFRIGNR